MDEEDTSLKIEVNGRTDQGKMARGWRRASHLKPSLGRSIVGLEVEQEIDIEMYRFYTVIFSCTAMENAVC